jgi:hypothetical protein
VSYLIAAPQYLASAATDLAGIGSIISEANTFAAGPTLGVLPAGADEVSAAMAALFDAHGQAYQALSAQAALFHDQFVQILNGAGNAYAAAEANAVQLMANAVSAPAQAVSAAPGTPLQRLEQAEIGLNASVVNSQLVFNRALLTNEIGLQQSIFGTNMALNGVINRGFNFGNLLVGTGRQTADSLLGFQTPPLGAPDLQLAIDPDLASLLLIPAPVQALASSPSGLLQQITQAQIPFNGNLVNSQLEERNVLGTNSAVNAVINRSFNGGQIGGLAGEIAGR